MGFGGLVRADMQFWRFCLHHSTFMSVWSGSSNMYIWAWPLGAKNLVAKSQIPEIVFETENDVRLHFQHHKSWISRWTDPAPHHSTRVTRVYGLFLGEIMWCTNENHPSADARLTEAARRWRCFSKPMHDHHRRPSPEISRRSRVRRHPETGDWMILWDIFQIMGFSLGFVYCIHLYTVSIFFMLYPCFMIRLHTVVLNPWF